MLGLISLVLLANQSMRAPIPYKVASKLPDVAVPCEPAEVKIGGYLGHRIDLNETHRLTEVDLEPLLAGYRKKPGVHPWIGEHIGKWMHAATLAWAYTGDSALRTKLDYAAKELIKTQETDGYLGTYLPSQRFGLFPNADWDVWSHKYNLIGLLTYYRFTGYEPALTASRRIGDLLIATFGPGKRDILSAGTHVGMAATSVLEPIVLLYRHTGEAKYLDFAKYIVSAWAEPNGPHILERLSAHAPIQTVGNGKAYEMLSNIVGLCELARATGDRQFLKAAEWAWQDVVANQRYITGTASYREVFHDPHDLPNTMDKDVGETCVTVTWLQLSEQLLRLTGEAKYGDEIERSLYNHLAAAQRPDGSAWCYYTSLDGSKPYTTETCCCLSSGPRGLANATTMAYLVTRRRDGTPEVMVNLLESSSANLKIDGVGVHITQTSKFPFIGENEIRVHTDRPIRLGLLLRTPSWANELYFSDRPEGSGTAQMSGGWTVVEPIAWQPKDVVRFTYRLKVSSVAQNGHTAIQWGPFVLAHEGSVAPALAPDATVTREAGLNFVGHDAAGKTIHLVPFAEAGASGQHYQVWFPTN